LTCWVEGEEKKKEKRRRRRKEGKELTG